MTDSAPDPIADPPCLICPRGRLIYDGPDSLELPSITGGGTCKSVASMALGGCFDETHCYFLQKTFFSICCISPSSDLPVLPSDGSFIDTKNNTIVPDNLCVEDASKNATTTNSSSIFPGGDDDSACYQMGSSTVLCLENIFGELCYGAIDDALCNSCDMNASIATCDDGGLPGVHLDCTIGSENMKKIDICNDGTMFVSDKSCFQIVKDLEYGMQIVDKTEYEVCIETMPEKQCTVSLDGTLCNSCSYLASGTSDNNCLDFKPAYSIDCSNVDTAVDVDLCSDGSVVNLHPNSYPSYGNPSSSSSSQGSNGHYGNPSSSSSSQGSSSVFMLLFGAFLVLLRVSRRQQAAQRSQRVEGVSTIELPATGRGRQEEYSQITPVVVARPIV